MFKKSILGSSQPPKKKITIVIEGGNKWKYPLKYYKPKKNQNT